MKQTIAIAGFGIEGHAVYEYFKDTADIHIFDERLLDAVPDGATFHLGLIIPAGFSVVYKSPGIPTSKLVLESPDTRITTFMDVALEKVRDRAIGVTGTKGKSTISALMQHVLESAGRDSVLFGNIGIADANMLRADDGTRTYVFELSSYQCEYLQHSPHIAVFNNFFPEHLSHHGSLDKYQEAKLNIARFQTETDYFVNGTDIKTDFAGTVITPDFSRIFKTKLIGEHNQRNCAVAYAALTAYGLSDEEIEAGLKTFEALPYRLEPVGIHNGITFYDDSLATVPEATVASIKALEHVNAIILGGENRGISFESFAEYLATTDIKTFIVFPDTGSLMVTHVADRMVVPVATMEQAVRAAYEHTPEQGTVLLSNASPSFNLFKDYKDKSAQYRHWIAQLEKGAVG